VGPETEKSIWAHLSVGWKTVSFFKSRLLREKFLFLFLSLSLFDDVGEG